MDLQEIIDNEGRALRELSKASIGSGYAEDFYMNAFMELAKANNSRTYRARLADYVALADELPVPTHLALLLAAQARQFKIVPDAYVKGDRFLKLDGFLKSVDSAVALATEPDSGKAKAVLKQVILQQAGTAYSQAELLSHGENEVVSHMACYRQLVPGEFEPDVMRAAAKLTRALLMHGRLVSAYDLALSAAGSPDNIRSEPFLSAAETRRRESLYENRSDVDKFALLDELASDIYYVNQRSGGRLGHDPKQELLITAKGAIAAYNTGNIRNLSILLQHLGSVSRACQLRGISPHDALTPELAGKLPDAFTSARERIEALRPRIGLEPVARILESFSRTEHSLGFDDMSIRGDYLENKRE
ncbi:hypothetical protein HYU16_01315 [Candidatus Woesearchaeota archaeon]|nr:hypothetical protein [Candidatus Woesearchaeota archaeon]